MREVWYRVATDLTNVLMKKVRDPEEGIYTAYIWNSVRQDWVEAWEICCGYFVGFEPSFPVTEEEAEELKKIIWPDKRPSYKIEQGKLIVLS